MRILHATDEPYTLEQIETINKSKKSFFVQKIKPEKYWPTFEEWNLVASKSYEFIIHGGFYQAYKDWLRGIHKGTRDWYSYDVKNDKWIFSGTQVLGR